MMYAAISADGKFVAGDLSLPELVGVIVAARRTHTRWVNRDPVCRSSDGVVGVGEPGGACVGCPMLNKECKVSYVYSIALADGSVVNIRIRNEPVYKMLNARLHDLIAEKAVVVFRPKEYRDGKYTVDVSIPR